MPSAQSINTVSNEPEYLMTFRVREMLFSTRYVCVPGEHFDCIKAVSVVYCVIVEGQEHLTCCARIISIFGLNVKGLIGLIRAPAKLLY
jgi:hypothetical protein